MRDPDDIYLRGSTCRGFRMDVVTLRVMRDSLADFLQRCPGIRTRTLVSSFMLLATAKSEFFRIEIRLKFRAVNE